MKKPENRSQFMDRLGAKQLNTMWSWCAVDDNNKKVYFSAWLDMKIEKNGKKFYILQEPHWGVDEQTNKISPARKDQDNKFDLVLNHGYKAFAYFIEAEDINAVPRSIKSIKTSFVFSMELDTLDDGTIIGLPINRIEVN